MTSVAMSTRQRTRIARYEYVRIVLALVLLVAAALKGHQLATSPMMGDGVFESRWVLIGTVEFELFFGLWLLANILPTWTHRALLVCFGVFAAVSLCKAISGAASCGCFGRGGRVQYRTGENCGTLPDSFSDGGLSLSTATPLVAVAVSCRGLLASWLPPNWAFLVVDGQSLYVGVSGGQESFQFDGMAKGGH